MSHPSPNSSSANGPPSSPFSGTNPTLYSPEFERKSHHHRQLTAIAPGQQVPKHVLPQPPIYIEGNFIDELDEGDVNYVSRYQHVRGGPGGVDLDHLQFLLQAQMRRFACFLHAVPFKHEQSRTMFVRYDAVSDAAQGKDILIQAGLAVDYVSFFDYANAQGKDFGKVKEFEGQISLTISIKPNPDHAIWEFTSEDLDTVTDNVTILARSFGRLRNVLHIETLDAEMELVYRVEFDSVDAEHRAIQSIRRDPVCGVNVDETFLWATQDVEGWQGERLFSPPKHLPSIDNQGRFFPGTNASPAEHGYPTEFVHRFQNNPHDSHNRVRRERILDGSDVRTTVMLRNIPKTLDWMALKNLIDIACFGTYDFLYLRIDFHTGNNVGYAFINFTEANGMLMLIDRIEHKFFPGFPRYKAAEISYATIQGREALVQKFRNSSVMQETPFCRPHLIVTEEEAKLMRQVRLTGTVQPFPRPDNMSKLQRSIDSARSAGLYTARNLNKGNDFRTRASEYDRGTPRDMMQAAFVAHQHAAPLQFAGITDIQKREIEAWYLDTYGGGLSGAIGFNSIPMTHITQYLEDHPPRPTRSRRSISPWRPVALQHFSTMGQSIPRHYLGRNL